MLVQAGVEDELSSFDLMRGAVRPTVGLLPDLDICSAVMPVVAWSVCREVVMC